MEQIKDDKQVIKRLLSYVKPYKRQLAIAFLFLFLGTGSQVLGPILVKIFIDDYLIPEKLEFQALLGLSLAYLFLYIASFICNYMQLFLFQKTALHIIQQIRMDVFEKVQQLGLRFFDRVPGGSLVSRITNDTEAIKELYVNVISTFIQSTVFLIGIFIAMFFLNAKLAFYCILLIPLLLFIMKTYQKYSSIYYHQMREKLSQLNAKLSESMQGMMIIQMFRQERRLQKEFSIINEEHYQAGLKNLKLEGILLRPLTDLINVLALIVVLSFFGLKSFQSPIEVGVLFAFVTYLDRFFEPVNQIMMRLSLFQQAVVSASRVFHLMDEKEEAPRAIGQNNPKITEGKITFQNVTFSYDGKKEVLQHISFTANPGEMIALVGHTGSGKSSIINLLMRFYDTYKGDIHIDGVSLREYENEELREKMGLVLQDPFIFSGTIKENITLNDESIPEQEMIEAAKFVQADTFIERLPNSYKEKVGERGATFSSGQRQLLAFARTMVKNPKILVLDEATATIDTQTEELIQESLNKMRKGRTTIAIAHRLSTIKDADHILVLHQGKIMEVGSHSELLSKKGLYHKMYILQHGDQSGE